MADPYRLKAPPPPDAPGALPRVPTEVALGRLRLEVAPDRNALWRALPRHLIIPVMLVILGGAAGRHWGVLVALPIALLIAILSDRSYAAAPFRRFRLHQGGVVYHLLGGSETVRFDDVDEVRILSPDGWPAFACAGLILKQHDRTVHRLDLLWLAKNDSAALIRAIVSECSDELLPAAKEALAAGETLRFGDVSIDAVGIESSSFQARRLLGPRRLRWSEVRAIRVKAGSFQLEVEDDHPMLIPVDSVPHPTVVRALLQHLGPWRDGGPT